MYSLWMHKVGITKMSINMEISTDSVGDAGDAGLIPGSGRSLGERNGNPLQYPYLENPMDRGALSLLASAPPLHVPPN